MLSRSTHHSVGVSDRSKQGRWLPARTLFTALLLFVLFSSAIGPSPIHAATILPLPVFSVPHGIESGPISLALSSPSGGAIRYTLDGSTPTPTSGTVYSSPISINKTTVVRAIAYTAADTSFVATQSYIYLANTRTQSATQTGGWPKKFAADEATDPETGATGYYPADYEMDPQVVGHYPSAQVDSAMTAIPTLSMVTDLPNLWDPSYGIYYNPSNKEPYQTDPLANKWERPISLEWIDPTGATQGFSVQGGARINGQSSRRPKRTPKKSFKVYFKASYGTGKLDFQMFNDADATSSFDRIVLRNGGNRSWHYFDRDQRREADYINDEWARRAWLKMGNIAPHGTFVHLYINGLYWGLYNPTERIDEKFAQTYFGGQDIDYDMIEPDEEQNNVATASAGVIDGWTELLGLVNGTDPITDAQYNVIKTKVDLVSLADYFVHAQYIGKTDWPQRNWNAFRRRIGPDTRFKFIPWDNDSGLNKLNENTTLFHVLSGPDDAPSRIFLRMVTNAEFRQILADRLYKHVVDPTGALAPTQCTSLYSELAGIIDQAIIGESARWGDYVRDTLPMTNSSLLLKTFPAYLYTRDMVGDALVDPNHVYTDTEQKNWLTVRDAKLAQSPTGYCLNRSNVLRNEYVANGWYQTALQPPQFSQRGGAVAANYDLVIDNTPNTGTGDIYYTLDGSDPRLEFGAVAPNAINGADTVHLPIAQVTHVMARVLNGTTWSPLEEYTFYPPQPFSNLVITELHYNPVPPTTPVGEVSGDYEFVELLNKGTTPLRLDNAYFKQGISYHFPANTTIWPGQYLVLASKDTKFQKRYGFLPFADYHGGLSNLGDTVVLADALGNTVDSVPYGIAAPWPTGANGGGGSLCLTDVNADNSLAANWTTSNVAGGTPGAAGCDNATAQSGVWLGPSSLNFGEQPGSQPSLPQTVTLANAGARPLVIASLMTNGDFAQTNACPTSLGAGMSCLIDVTFTPTAAGARSGALLVESNAPGSPHSVALAGVGVGGFRTLTLDAASLNFDSQTVRTPSQIKTVKLTNSGTLAVTITGIMASDDFTQTNDCPTVLEVGASCTIKVTFKPTAAGTRTGSLIISSNAPNTPQTVVLTGAGNGGSPELVLSSSSLTFDTFAVGTTSEPQLLTVTNTGSASAAIGSISVNGAFAQTNTCGATLEPGLSCVVSVTFRPTVVGTQNGTITIISNAPDSPQLVTVTGTGTASTGSVGYKLFLPTISH